MPIKDLQQQQAQVGRIRIGQQVAAKNGKLRPEKLDRFRFTSASRALVDAVARQYGGVVEAWTPDGRPAEFEVISDARTLPVLIPPRPVTQFYEMWSGAGCQRRCDGEIETLSGDPCKCPLDHIERGDLAAKGAACKATTRLKVMLPEIPGIGVWRLDTHGYYAAIELPQTADFLGAVTDAGGYIRATLALEERQVKRPGVGIRTFLVPALHVDVTPEALMAGAGTALAGPATTAITTGAVPAQVAIEAGTSGPAVDLAQAIADRALSCASRDEVAALWREAKESGLLGESVADEQGVMESLEGLLSARGRGLAGATSVSSSPVDADALWFQIVAVAAGIDDPSFDLDIAFADWSRGLSPGAATADQLAAYLEHLQSGPVRA